MNTDQNLKHGLILAAGYGTRMGAIGKVLPKALWPIFETTMLELQINYLNNLGVDKIFINTHHCFEKLQIFVKNKQIDVEVIHEPEILGVGGAVYNLAHKLNFEGTLVISNCDQLIIYSQTELNSMFELLNNEDFDVSILLQKVKKNSNLNQVCFDNRTMTTINKSPDLDDYFTYAGIGAINLSKLDRKRGFQPFFGSVAKFEQGKVATVCNQADYFFDFGTLNKYGQNLIQLMNIYQNKIKPYYEILKQFKIINPAKLNMKIASYNSALENVINLSGTNLENKYSQCIVIKEPLTRMVSENFKQSVVYDKILEQTCFNFQV